jgi:uncharacterized protein with HEPN domain
VNRDITICRDLLARIAMIRAFTAEGRDLFLKSVVTQEAVIRCFEVIGEAIKRMDQDLLTPYPEVPWSDFTGFRNFLIHQYDKIELPLVWDVIERDLPPLQEAVQQILAELLVAPGSDSAS